jgi:hypothetical protein
MRVEKFIADHYKPVARYVQNMLPIMPRYVPDRYKIYEEHCTDAKTAEQGITWGRGPELRIDNVAELLVGTSNEGRTAAGLFSPDRDVDAIFLEGMCADKYKANPQKYHVAMQYLLLHELIHWARHKVGAKDDGTEHGDAFEKEAYGQDCTYLWRH